MIYRQAKDKRRQIKILADLNCCSVGVIKEIIGIQEDAMDEIKPQFREIVTMNQEQLQEHPELAAVVWIIP